MRISLQASLRELSHVWAFDNDNRAAPFRPVTVVEPGRVVSLHAPVPKWLRPLLPKNGTYFYKKIDISNRLFVAN